MKAKPGNFYRLKQDKSYFVPVFHQRIYFTDPLAVKCTSNFGDGGHFGTVVNTSAKHGPDYEGTEDIEFGDNDVVSEYKLRDMDLIFMDFPCEDKTIYKFAIHGNN